MRFRSSLRVSGVFVVLCLSCGMALGRGRICFEAEAGAMTEPVQLADDAKSSGGRCIAIAEGVNGHNTEKPKKLDGDASYVIDVKEAGKYVMWVRCWWHDACGNSVKVSIDSGDSVILGQDGTYKRWHWLKLQGPPLKLTQGEHEIKLTNNEDGIKIDQLLLLTDGIYVPVAIEKVTCEPRKPESEEAQEGAEQGT